MVVCVDLCCNTCDIEVKAELIVLLYLVVSYMILMSVLKICGGNLECWTELS